MHPLLPIHSAYPATFLPIHNNKRLLRAARIRTLGEARCSQPPCWWSWHEQSSVAETTLKIMLVPLGNLFQVMPWKCPDDGTEIKSVVPSKNGGKVLVIADGFDAALLDVIQVAHEALDVRHTNAEFHRSQAHVENLAVPPIPESHGSIVRDKVYKSVPRRPELLDVEWQVEKIISILLGWPDFDQALLPRTPGQAEDRQRGDTRLDVHWLHGKPSLRLTLTLIELCRLWVPRLKLVELVRHLFEPVSADGSGL